MRLQAKFFAFVAPVLLAIALLAPAVWYIQLDARPMAADVVVEAAVMTAGLVVTALLTVYLAASRLVCRPMRRMAQQMHCISTGQQALKPLPEATRRDELGMAARAFNEVVEAMQRSTHQLQHANATLEKRVIGRTTELAHINAELASAETEARKLALIASKTHNPILITNPHCELEWANDAFTKLTGYTLAELVGRNPGRVLQGPDSDPATIAYMRECVKRGEPFQVEIVNYSREGTAYWLWIDAEPVRDDRGQVQHFIAFEEDITQRKRAEWLERDRHKLLEMIARNEPLPLTLQHVCHAAEQQCAQVRGMVLLHDGTRRQIGAAPKFPPRFVLALDETLNLEDRAGQDHLFEGVSGFVPDLRADPRWSTILAAVETEGLSACSVLPITAGHGKRVGEFVIFQTACVQFDEKIQVAIESLAGLAGLAIEHQQLTDRLEFDAVHDPLTGLPNRAQLETQLPQLIGAAARHQRSMAVLMIDLDGFKNVNDTLGHTTGDELLRQVASRLSQAIRTSDVLVRMGGDEFNLVATEIASEEDALIVGNRLINGLAAPFAVDGRELFVTASVGIAVYPQDGIDSAALQRSADSAMYASKAAGRNRAMRFDPKMGDAALDRLELEGQLRRAISNAELFVEYQPQVDVAGIIVGVEALVRWQHPRLGRIPPMRFIPLAEQCGLIVPIGAWVLREACWQARAWQNTGCRAVHVAVNVSALQFQQSDFLAMVSSVLTDTGLDGQYLELELTESLLLASTADAVEKVVALRQMGVSVAIDDFGTGYSSLAYLRRLPIDRLKIDQSFINELGIGEAINTDGGRGAIITAITSLARSLGKRVVAEGVETAAQRDYLIDIGCDTLQGYLFGKPMRADQIQEMLHNADDSNGALSSAA